MNTAWHQECSSPEKRISAALVHDAESLMHASSCSQSTGEIFFFPHILYGLKPMQSHL